MSMYKLSCVVFTVLGLSILIYRTNACEGIKKAVLEKSKNSLIIQKYLNEYRSNNSCTLHSYVLNTKDLDLVDWFMKKEQDCPKMIATRTIIDTSTFRTKLVYVFIDTFEQIEHNIQKLLYSDFWDYTTFAQFIVVQPVDNTDFLRGALRVIWKHNVVRFILVFVNHEQIEIFTYNPYAAGMKYWNFTKRPYSDLFPEKMNNLHGFKFRVSVYIDKPRIVRYKGNFYGRDYSLLKVITGMLNATFKFVLPHIKGDTSEVFEMVKTGQADFCFVSAFYTGLKHDVAFTYPHSSENLVVLVPPTEEIPLFEKFLMIFDYFNYILLLFCSIIIVIIMKISENRHSADPIDWSLFILVTFGEFLLNTVSKFHQFSLPTKFSLLGWAIGSIIFSTALQGGLVGNFLNLAYYKAIDTLAELNDSGLSIYITDIHKETLHESLKLRNRFITVTGKECSEMLVSQNTSGAIVVSSSFAQSYIFYTHLFGNKERKPFHIVKEYLVPGHSVYTFPKHSRFLPIFNNYLGKEKQHALSEGVFNKLKWMNATKSETEKRTKFIPLKFVHLKGTFEILCFGLALSLLIFIIELVY